MKTGPFIFDRYMGDTEPTIEPGGPLRLVIWQPIHNVAATQGWRKSWIIERKHTIGVATVPSSGDYTHAWSSHARRHVRTWRKQECDDWVIEPISYDTFAQAYKNAHMDPILKFAFLGLIRQKCRSHGGYFHLIGARRKDRTTYEAGFAYLHIPESRQMYHTVSFICPSAKHTRVGYGIMDFWFKHAQRIGVEHLDFGLFWEKGSPPSWKGFSRFKSQFGVQLIQFPRPYTRWAGSWWTKG